MNIATDMLGNAYAITPKGLARRLSSVARTPCAKVRSYAYRPISASALALMTDVHVRMRSYEHYERNSNRANGKLQAI